MGSWFKAFLEKNFDFNQTHFVFLWRHLIIFLRKSGSFARALLERHRLTNIIERLCVEALRPRPVK